jgi:hypothetical protein
MNAVRTEFLFRLDLNVGNHHVLGGAYCRQAMHRPGLGRDLPGTSYVRQCFTRRHRLDY